MRENRESLEVHDDVSGRTGKAVGRNPVMNAFRKSHIGVVPTKAPNKAVFAAAEALEERPMAKRNPRETPTNRAQNRKLVLSGLERVRAEARLTRGRNRMG